MSQGQQTNADSDVKQSQLTTDDNRVATYVDRLVQGTLVRQIVVHWIAFSIATTFVLALLTWMMNPFAGQREFLGQVAYRLSPIVLSAIFLVPLFIRDTIQFSHRMVGPMVRIRRELAKLAAGKKATRMEFRPNDYWQEVAGEFNSLCDYAEKQASLQ